MATRSAIRVGRRTVAVSNLDKVLFPGSGFTKGEVLTYYSDMAEAILPHLRNRPLTLLRMPDGYGGGQFYERNVPSHAPEWVKTVAVPKSEGVGETRYVLCNDAATLLWATNLGDWEKHCLLARAPHLDRPTSVVFDLDPGEGVGLLECGRVALEIRALLARFGLEVFVKVSGSKGLHLNLPLNRAVSYAQTRPFAKAVAEFLEEQRPAEVIASMSRAARRGKVFIDWSQNSDFKSTVCVHALRAKRDEPFVSVPISWNELSRALSRARPEALFFTPEQAVRRWRKKGDPFAPTLTLKQKLPAEFATVLEPAASSSGRAAGAPPLAAYRAKRKAERTPEPMPSAKPRRRRKGEVGRTYVIQKHDASRLHFDLRLEMEGVLRSWAVPKGLPLTPGETRLAVHVEDHPLEYGGFEGIIPAGNYGAGTVMLWDRGEYAETGGDPAAAFRAGKLHLVLVGQKLEGEWVLFRDRRDEEGKRWLILKAGAGLDVSAAGLDSSVLSGRSMEEIAAGVDAPRPKQTRARRRGARDRAV